MTPCEKVETPELKTNSDLAMYTLNLIEALDICSAKVEAIRRYYAGN